MREIKFRALTFNDEQWIHGLVYKSGSEGQWTEIQHDEGFSSIVDPETVGQYTGLIDNNGTEIYEGDIVDYRDWFMFDDIRRKVGVVKYEGASFIIDDMENTESSDCCLFTATINDRKFEVIGNIYENPELLENADN